ncbi:hypothetical protein VFPPC_18681 [Pochonia chlamydosporia 170]|uniref:Uncharacterized protein n=1 Tax=Pochonia chlamydosporia 170 TaxID=1380566 RepID=A0A219ASI3_METCM|nr:hypothetical protein VFPPC_18681 [Pochonia chlamydosporia 170]OWT43592.1 hypothetical protein VFPPC_18681 [Pochonia chlamydosporia 170]
MDWCNFRTRATHMVWPLALFFFFFWLLFSSFTSPPILPLVFKQPVGELRHFSFVSLHMLVLFQTRRTSKLEARGSDTVYNKRIVDTFDVR